MATLTDEQKTLIGTYITKYAKKNGVTVNWTKTIMSTAAQGFEDFVVSNWPAISANFDAKTTPSGVTLPVAVKIQVAAIVSYIRWLNDEFKG